MYWLILFRPYSPSRLQGLELGDDPGHQLHDDRGVDVRVHPEADDREARQPAAREQVEQPEQRVVVEELRHRRRVRSGHGHVRQEAEDDQDPGDEQDSPPEVRRSEGVEQVLDHGQASPAGASSPVESSAGCVAVGAPAAPSDASAAAGSGSASAARSAAFARGAFDRPPGRASRRTARRLRRRPARRSPSARRSRRRRPAPPPHRRRGRRASGSSGPWPPSGPWPAWWSAATGSDGLGDVGRRRVGRGLRPAGPGRRLGPVVGGRLEAERRKAPGRDLDDLDRCRRPPRSWRWRSC